MANSRNSGSNQGLIIRLRDPNEISESPICRTTGYLSAANLLSLFEATDLTANPRLPRVNEQVKDMWKAIEEGRGQFFHYKNNGILLATTACESLERDRFRLRFETTNSVESPRGVLNGGHTMLACISSLIRQVASRKETKLPKFGLWKDFRETIWPDWRAEVLEQIEELQQFLVPIEILHPYQGQDEQFDNLIHEIAEARNNNCELTDETASNHSGFYEDLKAAMPDDKIRSAIEWRTNDGGRIKARDVVALACVPLSLIAEEIVDHKFDLKHCYNSAAKCTSFFSEIYQKVSVPVNAVYQLNDDEHGRLMASAIALTRELVELYDWLMIEFPLAYNRAGGKFGNITGMRQGDDYVTRYRELSCEYSYSDGFFMPILAATRILIAREENRLYWSQNPKDFLERNLDRIMRTFKGVVKANSFDGRLLGRDQSVYEMAFETLSMIHEMENLQESAS